MASLLDKLPSIIVLGVLVGIFVTLQSQGKTARLRLWTTAWILVFVHFLMQLFSPLQGGFKNFFYLVIFSSLQLASIFFIASLTPFLEDRKKTWTLVLMISLPVMVFEAGFSYDWQLRPLDVVCLACIFYGPAIFITSFRRRFTYESLTWMPVVVVVGTWSIYEAWNHNPSVGFVSLLTVGFAMPSLLFCTRMRRWSPGVIASAGGFLLWGAFVPLSKMASAHFPEVQISSALWDTPKVFVALGMILTLLEDKSAGLEAANLRERRLNEQMQKFASITSRLLTGTEVNSLCHDIAEAITETTNFCRTAIVLGSDGKGFYLAGHSGLSPETVAHLQKHCTHLRAEHLNSDIDDIRRVGGRLGQNSYLLKQEEAQKYCPMHDAATFPPNAYWQSGYELVVPLQSTRGAAVGWIFLDDPRDLAKITADEMSKIELLGGDLAVTISNTSLHRQLVRAEKLAAIGQLVAGVAHELNNPLASIVGYSELLGDEITAGPSRQKLDKLSREAQRMRRIIENLLRFARQNNLEKKSANLEALLQDVLALREYQIRKLEVDIVLDIEAGLPMVALDEDQFKQILLNLLNNSIDAMEHLSRKRIYVEAARHGERVVMRFEDSGPGFADVNRAFDPFYTTKPVGKGTGLGLSICYGIIKEHGGDIHAINVNPSGARIVMELPVYSSAPAAIATAS
ncbi:MAG TPA: HAMP domain-containing sensor histidine kinase [Candidatus Saccharimonadales bacterium]|jgi:two-component system NtrC family sensor kinase|nr:HAMP domain-containing sensor histidine kinase [Candidatus Saccharimonadales bacterium]